MPNLPSAVRTGAGDKTVARLDTQDQEIEAATAVSSVLAEHGVPPELQFLV